ncbi:methionine adenosyltransferase [Mycoplasma miroungirhinis]|uniref:S-adenosylmethionine synthase n=1 Tax=Mycoplasma miroungirhinis TaxID=754516 RepID=A0A6M4JCU2_9MOLU|nr:methionine adenosyltransferase [Mycoplasma miroungirhinis]QJR44175.1 methionine adenosyltransferase [Mycoplasma miroungirhinis]
MSNFNYKSFTAESVGAGHPDKICDQISDAILDSILKKDKNARVACEVFATNRMIVIGGEISTTAYVDVVKVAWKVLKRLDYKETDFSIVSAINSQSPDIALGVDQKDNEIGAGDQGIVYGYAINETSQYIPLSLAISHELVKEAEYLRKTRKITEIKSDMKSQVTCILDNHNKFQVQKVLMSIQHFKNVNLENLKSKIKKMVIDPVLKKFNQDINVEFLFNPTGRFIIGGPVGDTGLTGRKIIVDTYGGRAHHGGGAFSGKDYTKIDRSAAYMARYIAKNIVAANWADEIEIQISYAIGRPKPQSIAITTFNSAKIDENLILKAINENFDLSVKGIINTLDLKNVSYLKTATYGHFGRDDENFNWEKLDKVDQLKAWLLEQ